MGVPRPRTSSHCNKAIASFARAAERGIGRQPLDCCQVAQAFDRGRSEDRSEKAALNHSYRSGGGNDHCIQAAYAAADG